MTSQEKIAQLENEIASYVDFSEKWRETEKTLHKRIDCLHAYIDLKRDRIEQLKTQVAKLKEAIAAHRDRSVQQGEMFFLESDSKTLCQWIAVNDGKLWEALDNG